MFSAIKSLLFKNNNAIAEQIWLPFSVPINLIRFGVSNKSFLDKFYEDKYLPFFFTGYHQYMLKYFLMLRIMSTKEKLFEKF